MGARAKGSAEFRYGQPQACLSGTTMTNLATVGLFEELRPTALALASTALYGERMVSGGWALSFY